MKTFYTLLFCFVLFSCGSKTETKLTAKTTETALSVSVPEFNADSAHVFTANQVAFGPRVPNTEAHRKCGEYLVSELIRFGLEVTEQEVTLETYDNQELQAKNIIASFQPENKNRILLCAHWDSRPFADQDPDPKNHHTPIDGANDGAGATGCLLEIARQLGLKSPAIGIDIILFDAEDWGAPEFDKQNRGGWCLGSRYWAAHPHIPRYTAKYGILLDMVSAPGAQFYKEYYSTIYAGNIVKKVWEAAQATGYDNYFTDKKGGAIEDDHIPVNQIRKIPCIDIIQHDPSTPHSFGHYWHTLKDNMDEVSTETLKAVGQTVMYVVYNEN